MITALKLRINDQPIVGIEGETILTAARRNRIEIPVLCGNLVHDSGIHCEVSSVGIKGRSGTFPACSTLISNGMEIFSMQPRAPEIRKAAVHFLMTGGDNHDQLPDRQEKQSQQSVKNT